MNGNKAAKAAPKGKGREAGTLVPQIRKKELVDRLVAETDLKKRDVGIVVDAMLALLGKDLGAGKEMNLPPLGKIKVAKSKEMPNATVLTLKLRMQNAGEKPGRSPLAETGD